jgi:branched-subunit amino acid ABC-type transport system permease component
VLGRQIYAVGGNANAARLSGVDTRKVDFFVLINMGVLSAIAGMVFTAYLNAANPKDGVGFELDAIAAVFIGGAAVAGGVGTVVGSMIGGLVMGVLNLGLANMSVDSNFIQVDGFSEAGTCPQYAGLVILRVRGDKLGDRQTAIALAAQLAGKKVRVSVDPAFAGPDGCWLRWINLMP